MRRLRQELRINPIDTQPNIAVGVSIPFNGTPVFNSTYTTKNQIKSNIINFFLTNQGERIMNPNYGGGLRAFLFEPATEIGQLQDYLSAQLEIRFPQVTIITFNIVDNEDNSITINFAYSINGQQDNITIKVV